jgi:hypothetical protein
VGSKTLIYGTNHFTNISNQGCDSWSSASYSGGGGRRIAVWAILGEVSLKAYLKNKLKTKRLGPVLKEKSISGFYKVTYGGYGGGQSWKTGLISKDWAIWGSSWPWIVRLGRSFFFFFFFYKLWGYGSVRPWCMAQVIPLMSAVQDVIPYQHPNHCSQPLSALTPCLIPMPLLIISSILTHQ